MRTSANMKFAAALLSLLIIIGNFPVIPLSADSDVSYIDENGIMRTTSATVIANTTTTLTSGWYIVQGNVSTTNLRVSGSVYLILADGCVLTAGANSNKAGIEMEHENFLTIYGQSLNTGKIIASGNGRGSGLGGSGGVDGSILAAGETGGHCGNLTINGGTVIADRLGGGDGGKGISDRNLYAPGGRGGNGGIIVLNRGTLSVSGNMGGGNGGYSTYLRGGNGGDIISLTVTGGTLTAGALCGGTGGDGSYALSPLGGGIPYPIGIAGDGGNGGTININGGSVDINGRAIDYLGNIGGGRAGHTSALSASPGRGGNGSNITVRGGNTKVAGIIGGGSGSPWLNSKRGGDGSCVITGGSLTAALILPVPTNGSENGNKAVYNTTATLEGVDAETAVFRLSAGANYSYGTKDLLTDADGRMSLWLPEGVSATKAYTTDKCFTGSVAAGTSGILSEMPPDTAKPAIISVSPGKGAVSVPVSGRIIVTFNEMLQASSGIVSLASGSGNSSVLSAGTWSSDDTVYSAPYSGLSQGESYTMTFSEFQDLAGNRMDVNTSYSFTVVPPIPMFDFSYLDETGAAKTVSTYKIDSSVHSLTTGWYTVEGTLSLSNMTISGDVKLILTDGCDLTVTGTGSNAAVRVKNGNSLTVYGQALGSGTLRAAAAGRGAGIGGNGGAGSAYDTSNGIGESCGIVKIYGGTVITDHIGGGDGDDLVGFSAGKGGSGGSVAIHGGTVTVSSRIGGGDGGDGAALYAIGGDGGDGSALTITGGSVTVSGKIGGGAGGYGSDPLFHLTAKAGAAGSCIITGGSSKVTSMQPTPRNGSANGNLALSRTTVTLAGASEGLPVKTVVTNRPELYGTRDMKTDLNSNLYLWLPSGASVSAAYAQDEYYVGLVPSSTSGTLALAPADTDKPVLLSSEPAAGETDVQPDGSISMAFSKVMDTTKGIVNLSADGVAAIVLSGGVWTYGGTVFTIHYSDLSYSTDYIAEFAGFQDISGIAQDACSVAFTTIIHPKTVMVSPQSGELINTSPGSTSYMVSTISIDSGAAITLNNIHEIAGVSLETSETSGDSTIVSVKTTDQTPAGLHTLTLTIDGITSLPFNLEITEAVHAIALSQTGIYDFPKREAGYSPFNEYVITVTNTGNLPAGMISISLTGAGSSSFTLSTDEIADIGIQESSSFGICPEDGLPAGTYSATVVLSGAKITSQTFDVRLTVNKRTGNLVSSITFPSGATIRGTSIYATVDNNVTNQQIALTVSDGASWKLFGDIACTDEITDKTMVLEEGANMAFLVVTAENGNTKLYAVSVMRMEGLLLGNPQTGDMGSPSVFVLALTMLCMAVLTLKLKKRETAADT
ncbi:MAG: Ig-like domain-containing protein [Saccharofermentanales bacterium]